ncbi:hypothetical protein [Candidatus Burkholderia verschuerenii]|uniref:hypothetical protein n=1 Tax=Candidatus Burkholderia verschuerenii TaxID=242163 RepID=UPI001E4FDFE2|nr:hypothetical protein [Candidatus Burkholderia verschuerenii]
MRVCRRITGTGFTTAFSARRRRRRCIACGCIARRTNWCAAAANTTPTLAAATGILDGTPLGTAHWSDGSTTTSGTGQAVSGLNCKVAGNSYTYSHLSIYLNGQQLTVPTNIGAVTPSLTLQTGCVYPIHTDDASGKIRMDVTTAGSSYTLGQFFAVWGQTLSSSNVTGIAGTVTAWVNNGGTLTQYTGDLASLPLTAKGEITLEIGTPLTQIPTYTWTDPPAFDTTNVIALNYGGVVGSSFWPTGNTSSGGTGTPVDGATCAAGMAENYHVHPHLAIIKDGQWLALPAQIGILSSCNYEMHTHDSTGIIHVETPAYKQYTLGMFFDIWGQPLSTTNVAGITSTSDVVVYINDNGDSRRYIGDPRNIVLQSHRDITIQIGSPVSSLATYSWYEPQ